MKLLHCENPFQPHLDRYEYELNEGESLAQALAFRGIDPDLHVISCNGEILPPERALAFVPRAEDYIVAMPDLQNQTLKSLAMIGVLAAAAVFSGGLGTALYGALSGIGPFTFGLATAQAIATTAITIGGTLLVNGVAGLFSKPDSGASYTWNGAQTTSRSGLPIPKGAGTFQPAGNVVESWVDMQNADVDDHDTDDGADKIGRQWMNLRVDFGFGPATSVTDMRINDKDIANYSDVAYCIRLGTNDQTAVTASDPGWVILNQTTTGDTINTAPTADFNRINNNYPVTQRVRSGIAHNYCEIPGTRNDTERLEVVVQFPNGVWRLDDGGTIKRAAIDYDVYYRVKGSGDAGWVLAQHHYYYNIRQTILRQRTLIDGLAANCYDVKVVKNGSGAVDNPLDYFEHESNQWGDELWIESVQETSYTALSYPNMIQICFRIMATDQLAGSGISVSALVNYAPRSTKPAQLAALADDNPAIIAFDMFSDPLTGAGLPESRIDLDAFAEWGALCDTLVDNGDGGTQKLAVFNGVFDTSGRSIWDAFQSVCVMSRATAQQIGTKVTVAIDQEEDPVQMFHVGNILLDSYSKEYLNLDDRAQEVDITYANAQDDYKTRTPLRVITADDQASSEILKKTDVNLLGCTDTVQAYYWGFHRLLENKLKLRTHTWDSPAQAIVSRVGNVALLQHDVPQWANGGNVISGTATQLQLDVTDLVWDATGSYSLTVLHPSLLRATGTVAGISGNVLTVTGYDGVAKVLRAVSGDVDVAITGTGASGGSAFVKVEDATGFVAGAAVSLYDNDVMETRTVTALDKEIATVSPAFSASPADSAGYIYSSATKNAIKVRITGIKRKTDEKFTISAMDYAPGVYAIPAPGSGMSGGA